MKKTVALLLSAALLGTYTLPAYAADASVDTEGGSGNTTVTYSVNEEYVVTIPETVSLDGQLVISSNKANTEPGMAVKVRISNLTEDGKAELARTGDTDYKITAQAKQNDAAISNASVVATFADVTENTLAAPITFEEPAAESGEIKAGAYTGTLTFTINYEAE